MYFSDEEKNIIGYFYRYVTKFNSKKEVYLLKWNNGTAIYATSDTIYDSDNDLEMDDPDYEDFTSIVMNVEKVIEFNELDGFPDYWFKEGSLTEFNYHNFPDEIYNSKGELISKKPK